MAIKHRRVFITGATGFVGANLVRNLIDKEYEVHILTRKTSNKWRLFDILHKIKNYTVDLTDFPNLKKTVEKIKPEFIFHLATAGVYGGRQLPERDVINTNLLGTFNLINACADINYKCFINTGSSSEYGPKDSPMKETDICEPVNMYGITKLASTLYGKNIAKSENKPIITLRLFSPFGPYDDIFRLIPYAILNSLEGKDLQLANPKAVRDYVYVGDVIQVYMEIIKKADSLRGEVFNVGSGREVKISQVIEKIMNLTNSKSQIFWNKIKPRSFDTDHWEADITKTKEILNLNNKIGLDEGLKRTIEWFKTNSHLYKIS